ncbi:ABC transporter ATP-binding protein [Weissella oryzae SG25]|uniref:ABC transporter ATP-binding protein n=1 Tax=Weissella oryzae (strain DSM 25784 / JCM 18191 / LMG 30913 / SG25) TaxID=1329250 RepID=A0A069CRV2_WEIOS|nr:ABC transporter ATP-binding protein [Weissella oryzae]GAK30134.1 ABC transporter ATP-binding protein [Weissella oryzae SG25]
MLLKVNHVKKIFKTSFSKEETIALVDIDFSVETGEYVAIMGESGSGKTTLLNILSTLEQPTRGQVTLADQEITRLTDKAMADFRKDHLGFVFQDFNLLDTLSVRDNIYLPLVLNKVPLSVMQTRLAELAPQLGLTDFLDKQPFELSGGQKQKVAIARALISQPDLILADEPTAALDFRNSENLLQLFEQINTNGQTILMVTHSSLVASHAKRVLFIKDGILYHQLYRGNKNPREFAKEITLSLNSFLGGM